MLCCDACGKLYYAQPGSLLCREYAHAQCVYETLPQSALEDYFELALMLQYNKE